MPLDQPRSAIDQRTEDLRMSFADHLEELRSRLILAVIGVGLGVVIAAVFGFRLIGLLAQPLLQAQDALGYPPQTYTFDSTAGFFTYMVVVLIAGLILAGPWVLYQAWQFVVSGLYTHERRAVHVLWPFSVVMTAAGLAFTYFVLLPVTMVFFFQFSTYYPEVSYGEPGFMMRILVDPPQRPAITADPDAQPLQLPVLAADPAQPRDGDLWLDAQGRTKLHLRGQTRVLAVLPTRLMSPMPQLGDYIRFAAFSALGIVIAFQLPLVMLVLGRTGLVDPNLFSKGRKYAIFICFAAAAILTPADLLSMFVLAVPLYGLFELGLILMRAADPHTRPPREL
jgi:sec-independent protein translocase protein TatC